jgi:hypothetical protein
MRLFFLVLLIAAGIYYVQRRGEVENVVGGPITLKMDREEVLKSHGNPAQMHTERGGREVWIYEDGRLVEIRDQEVIRSEPPRPENKWTRLTDGSWVRQPPRVTGKSGLAKGPTPRGSAASLKAREEWGWDRQGTSLDQPAKVAK